MTEDEARAWAAARFGDAAVERLSHLASLVIAESANQNLIARSTFGEMWTRHLVDSAQLVLLAPEHGLWLDIGTGAGFPGLVIAALRSHPIVFAEPRRRRADFLARAAAALGLANVQVEPRRVEQLSVSAAIISARAVAPVEKLLHAASGCATTATRWLLPRGRSGDADLHDLRQRWDGMFHVKQSLTDPASAILVAEQVRPR